MSLSISCQAIYYNEFNKGRELVIWGTGMTAAPVLRDLRLFSLDVSFFVSKEWNEKSEFMGHKVYSKDSLDKTKHYVVIGSTIFNEEIAKELLEMGFEAEKDFITYRAMQINIFSLLQERLLNSYAKKIEIHSSHTEVSYKTANGKSIKMNVSDCRRDVPSHIIEFKSFERVEEEMQHCVISHLPDEAVIFDIGANGGFYSLSYKTWFPKMTVHAFEPLNETYQILLENICLNKLTGIIANNVGLSDNKQEVDFYFNSGYCGNASMRDITNRGDSSIVKCKVTTLDLYVNTLNTRVDFMKMDVEGAELLVLKGGLKALHNYRPVIFMEMEETWTSFFGYHPNDIVSLLADIGYNCYAIKSAHLVPIKEVVTSANNFFIHSSQSGVFDNITKLTTR